MPFELPYFQFYPSDFLSDMNVVLMTNEQVGCYIKLLCYQWREGSIPQDDDQIATLLGVDSQALARLKPGFSLCFPNGMNPRLNKEREKALKKHIILSRAGKKRWPNKLQKIGRLKPGSNISDTDTDTDKTPLPPLDLAQKALAYFGEKHKTKPSLGGKTYQAVFDRDLKLLKDIVKFQGEQDTRTLIDIFFGENWENDLPEKRGYSVPIFKACIPAMLKRLAERKKDQARKEQAIRDRQRREDEARETRAAETSEKVRADCEESLKEEQCEL
jgi:uncharacterized protein YdaU (DUF1376 family)